jgi:hypothetical protein
MKLLPKHSALTLLVASNAGRGTPRFVVHENIWGAWLGVVTESPYKTRVPAKSAWLPAESTEVRITVFMKDAATSDEIYVISDRYTLQAECRAHLIRLLERRW